MGRQLPADVMVRRVESRRPFPVAQIGYPTAVMEWRFEKVAGILEGIFTGGEAPSRGDVGAFLKPVEPLVSHRAGTDAADQREARVIHPGPSAHPEFASTLLNEAARPRALRIQTPHLAKG